MASRFYSPNQQFCDATGAPFAGGTLGFFASGTSTPLSTFTDSALTIANTNPIVLDSAGRAGNVFLQNLAYKVVLADANGVQIWSDDPVYTSEFSTNSQFQTYPGNPNGHIAGNQGAAGVVPASVVWDSADNLLYICTATGTTLSAVWTAINTTPVGAVPTGQIVSFAGTSAPAGWLLCGGQAISRVTFAGLFGVVGTLYGVGDGSTTFNIPDCRGRVEAGKDDMNGVAASRIGTLVTDSGTIVGATLGSTGGSQNHVQTVGELVSHNHPASSSSVVTDPTHIHSLTAVPSNPALAAGGGAQFAGGTASSINTAASATGISVATSTSITNSGSSSAMAWLQPTIIFNKIIKT